jgi:hypothetical protein
MKVSSIKTVYDFMRYCRMPLWFQRSIRDMKVGDTFILGKYTQPVSHDSDSDSNCNERKLRAVEVDGKIKRVLINYKDYMPTHQLSAIVEAAFAMGALQLED